VTAVTRNAWWWPSVDVRGFCPSCAARRMAESAALLVDEVLPVGCKKSNARYDIVIKK